ncbi:MAG: PEP-CTERM sorting domain-containing protein [Nitrosomonadales bacterium]|nr:MAG: PEP-CTERM sorting domain-containing protein [Nitrosomonadales bacterium]
MSISKKSARNLGLTALLSLSAFSFIGEASATAFDAGIPAGWTCTGNCGTLGANGVVITSPEGGDYGWVASNTGITGLGLPGIGGTDGSRLRTSVFSANAGDDLQFYFNYVTSDGAGYADYAWSRLLDSSLNEVAHLFTARTTPGGNTVPGFGLPPIEATINPATVTVVPGGPSWTPLGAYSDSCYSTGCGYTGWVESTYNIVNAGNYILEFGVVDWADQIYDSGMAFDGITVGGVPIEDNNVPEPASIALMGLGLAGLAAVRRRKTA